MKINRSLFVFINTTILTLLNFQMFSFVQKNLNDTFLSVALFVCFFCVLYVLLSLLFVRFLAKPLSIFFFSTALFCVYFMHSYGILIDSDMILNAMQTDKREVSELLNLPLLLITLVCIAFSAFVIKLKITEDASFFKKTLGISAAAVLACAIFFSQTEDYVPFFRNHNAVRMYNTPFYQVYALYRYYVRFVKDSPPLESVAQDASLKGDQAKKLLVLVVGETARARNFSLGGYALNDTNLYTKGHDVIFFSDFSSCGTSTAVSLPCMFSLRERENFSTSDHRENALDVLEKTGISVSWLGNNSGGCKGVCARIDDVELFSHAFDGALLSNLEQRINNPPPRRITDHRLTFAGLPWTSLLQTLS